MPSWMATMIDHADELRRHAAKVYHWDSGDLRAVMVRAAVEIERLRRVSAITEVGGSATCEIAQQALDARNGDKP